jgi:hypothetical protein
MSFELLSARSNLKHTLEEIPIFDQFDQVAKYEESFAGETGHCRYARVYIVFGTKQAASDALDDVGKSLGALGWMPTARPYGNPYTAWSREFHRGLNERITISTVVGPLMLNRINPQELRALFGTTLEVVIDYVEPQVDGC